jgi:hypothetical protein
VVLWDIMGERISVEKGIELTRKFSKRQDKRHKRTHANAFETNINIRRALQGICGHCSKLNVETTHYEERDFVHLRCKQGLSPYNLYESTPLGEVPKCSGYDGEEI